MCCGLGGLCDSCVTGEVCACGVVWYVMAHHHWTPPRDPSNLLDKYISFFRQFLSDCQLRLLLYIVYVFCCSFYHRVKSFAVYLWGWRCHLLETNWFWFTLSLSSKCIYIYICLSLSPYFSFRILFRSLLCKLYSACFILFYFFVAFTLQSRNIFLVQFRQIL